MINFPTANIRPGKQIYPKKGVYCVNVLFNGKKFKGIATKKNEIFGKFRRGGLSSKIKFLDYLKECSNIRIDNGQNKLIVYLIFLIRFLKGINKVI